ncbi:Prolyl-tRNA synthetase [Giardia muris]|uniref:proline--tRNA ligase n=1 Tax=Giardia muris TaxID=5742 RepID=A0A4Z1T943_GIAMU|nr:Prolyl-tRNA synthetase [Giardia muris]|eukprot:TNJ30663.1 Prolyl-tRNA synthetase [Giardia muris]
MSEARDIAREKSKQQKQAIRGGDVTFYLPKTRDTFADWYDAVMDAAELVDRRYPVKGCIVFRPYGFFMENAIMRMCEEEYAKQGIELVLFPTVIPESYLKAESDHIKGFEAECFWVEKGGLHPLEERLALRPTSETAIYSMFAKWVRSYKDLPIKINQTCTIFRHETKNTKPLIRIREVHWNEAHCCHPTAEEAVEQLEAYWKVYDAITEGELCFKGIKLQRAPWDKFAGSVYTEVLDTIMPCGRVIQAASIHNLGQGFSKVFDMTYTNKDNIQVHPFLTCAGISTRVMACALSIHGDEKGLVLPPLIAQYQVVILPVGCGRKNNEEADRRVMAKVEEIRSTLVNKLKLRVHVDTNTSMSIGEKLYYYEVKGVPLRIELGNRDLEKNECVLVARDQGKDGKKSLSLDEVLSIASSTTEHHELILKNVILDELLAYKARLAQRAREFHESMVSEATSMEEIVRIINEKGGAVRFPFFTIGEDGKEWDDKLREQCSAEIRGYWPREKVPEGLKCALTGKPAVCYMYCAKAY